jgi:hypothetical protein
VLESLISGYYISNTVKEFDKDSFDQKYRLESGIIIIAPKRNQNDSIIVQFIDEKKAVGQKAIESISIKMKEMNIVHGIIISNAGLASSAEKVSDFSRWIFRIYFY